MRAPVDVPSLSEPPRRAQTPPSDSVAVCRSNSPRLRRGARHPEPVFRICSPLADVRRTGSSRPRFFPGKRGDIGCDPTPATGPGRSPEANLLGRPTAVPTSAERTNRLEASPAFASLLDSFRRELEQQLERWLEAKRDTAELQALRELIDDLSRLTAQGGKRIRPALVYYAFRACGGGRDGGARERAVWPLALATEFLHSYLLIHDDIMDHAETRRGVPSSHAHFRDVHSTRGLRGDAAHFGRSVGILVGDLAHSYAVELFATVEVLL